VNWAATIAGMPPRVLVVEDEENVAFVVTTALRHAGFDTIQAVDGREGLRLARPTPLSNWSSST